MDKDLRLSGVNLGGWLVLEKWITPSLFADTDTSDEYALMKALGPVEAAKRLKRHRESFVAEEDFKWLSKHGYNAVRIPVGYGIFGNQAPFIGAVEQLDWAMSMAEKYGLKVLIDLHILPGLPNDWNKSESNGDLLWPFKQQYIEKSLLTVVRIAERYKNDGNLWGIGLMNESVWDMPPDVLKDYFKAGYELVREHCDDEVAVVYHDNWRPHEYALTFADSDYKNLIMDSHFYQLFTPEDKALSLEGHLHKTKSDWRQAIADIQKTIPVIAGEWTMALPWDLMQPLTDKERKAAYEAFYEAELATLASAVGQFYWTYKTEARDAWSLRDYIIAQG